MPCHSQDLKARIPILFYEQHLTIKEICKILSVQSHLHIYLLCISEPIELLLIPMYIVRLADDAY